MADASSEETSWPWFSAADAVFTLLLVGILLTADQGMVDDPGLGWHLRNVDVLLEQSGWPTTDQFSGPRGGEPWLTNQWVGDAVLRFGEWWGGLDGIAAVTSLVLALTLRCLFCFAVERGVPWPVAFVWTYLAALGISSSWVARPNIFSILFVLLTTHLCVGFHEQTVSRRQTLWLIPLFAVWANTHGGFLAGAILLVATTAVEFAIWKLGESQESRQRGRRDFLHFLLVGVACFLATLVNPYHVELYLWTLRLLGDTYYMNLNLEWRSPDFHLPYAYRFEILMLLFPLIVATTTRRPSILALCLSVLWLHFALGGRRYVPLWVMVTVPMLAACSTGIPVFHRLFAKLQLSAEVREWLTATPRRQSWNGTIAVALAVLLWARFVGGYAAHDPVNIPAAALDRVVQIADGRTVFHGYNWGGYLTWHGWRGGLKNWIDDRNEVQGRAHIEEYFSILNAASGWRDKLDAANVELVCIEPGTLLSGRLTDDSAWRIDYESPYAVIFERRGIVGRDFQPADADR